MEKQTEDKWIKSMVSETFAEQRKTRRWGIFFKGLTFIYLLGAMIVFFNSGSPLINDKKIDAVLVLNCPTAIASSTEAAQAVIDTLQNRISTYNRTVVLTCWMGDGSALEARRLFTENHIPTYTTPAEAIRGFMQIVRYRKSQEMLMETPPNIPEAFTPDLTRARQIINKTLDENRPWLTESEAKGVLAAYAIPVVETYEAASPNEAAKLAKKIGGPIALKILSPDITHKSDVGGVSLNLETPDVVRENATAMFERVSNLRPDAKFQGFTVQPMIHRPHSHELIVGMVDDTLFGPVLLVGHGGVGVEVIGDKALALAPLNMHLAHEVIARTRIYRLLQGYRDRPRAHLDSIALTLVKVSQLVCDIADIVELDINPLLADENGVIALDARIKVVKATRPAADRLAILPYPKELEEILSLPDGQTLLIRPIRPEDEPNFQKIFESLSLEDIRLRFLHPMKILSHSLAAQLTQINYDREMALVVEGNNKEGEKELYGVVRIIADPDNERAEFAILLRHDMTGLGPMLLRRIIDYATERGIGEIFGDVLSDNRSILKLCRVFGFRVKSDRDDPGVMQVSLKI
jgi:acetyltransferase